SASHRLPVDLAADGAMPRLPLRLRLAARVFGRGFAGTEGVTCCNSPACQTNRSSFFRLMVLPRAAMPDSESAQSTTAVHGSHGGTCRAVEATQIRRCRA